MARVRCETCRNEYWAETFGEGCFICAYKKEQKKKSLSRTAQERRDARTKRRR